MFKKVTLKLTRVSGAVEEADVTAVVNKASNSGFEGIREEVISRDNEDDEIMHAVIEITPFPLMPR